MSNEILASSRLLEVDGLAANAAYEGFVLETLFHGTLLFQLCICSLEQQE